MAKLHNFAMLRVLVIEDDDAMRQMLCRMLRRLKITQLVEAENGEAGLKRVHEVAAGFDLVICDWNMPQLNGLEFIARAREHQAGLKVLMVSGRNDLQSIVEAKQSGITGYIVKPFSQQELKSKIERVAG
jgi:two-component system chemotaxis response regulator CheY